MGINQNEKGPLAKPSPPRRVLPTGAEWVTVHNNLEEGSLILPGAYYRDAIPAQRHASFVVANYDAFATDLQILGLVTKGHITIVESDEPAVAPQKTPAGPWPGSPNEWEREPPSDKVWHGKWNPRNPEEAQLKQIQDRLDAAEAVLAAQAETEKE